jgi:hypothetical protein
MLIRPTACCSLTFSKKILLSKKEAVLYEVRFWTLLPNGTIS